MRNFILLIALFFVTQWLLKKLRRANERAQADARSSAGSGAPGSSGAAGAAGATGARRTRGGAAASDARSSPIRSSAACNAACIRHAASRSWWRDSAFVAMNTRDVMPRAREGATRVEPSVPKRTCAASRRGCLADCKGALFPQRPCCGKHGHPPLTRTKRMRRLLGRQ